MHGGWPVHVSPVNPRAGTATNGETLPDDLFRAQPGEPHHYAYVVDDIEATVNRLVDQLGAGPFFLIENVPLENVLSRGEPAEFVHNSAFGSCDGSAIELIEVVSLAPERVERGFSGARPRIQHVGYVVPATEVADLRSSLDERGLTQYLSSQLGEVETTLHDASATLGHDIEIHVSNQGLHDFFSMVSGAAEGWDGSEPLRPVES
jgi:hypothetical protein